MSRWALGELGITTCSSGCRRRRSPDHLAGVELLAGVSGRDPVVTGGRVVVVARVGGLVLLSLCSTYGRVEPFRSPSKWRQSSPLFLGESAFPSPSLVNVTPTVRGLLVLSGPGYEREPRRRAIGSPGLPSQSAHRSRCAVTGDQLSRHFARLSESWPPVSGSHAAGCRLLPTSSDSLVMTLAGVVHRRAASCLAVVGVVGVEPVNL